MRVDEDSRESGHADRGRRRVRPPLDDDGLRELALAYVARFATSRAKLVTYLNRKLRERGWGGSGEPDAVALAERMVELGLVDDAAFAGMKAASLTRRGYGKGRIRQALAVSGIGAEDGSAALGLADEQALAAAMRFAQKKRIGPYAAEPLDQAGRQKALGAMLRAGHPMPLARQVVAARPGEFDGLTGDE